MIIPILHNEKQLQIKDLTRFDASKSVLVKGSVDPITSVIVKPGADGTDIEIFNANPKNWYVDFAFAQYKFDIDSTNSKIIFSVGATEYSTDAASGTYTLAALLAEVKSKMDAAAPTVVTLALDYRNIITLSATVAVKILLKANDNLFRHLGFTEDGQTVGNPVEYGIRKVTLTIASISESESIVVYMEVYSIEGDALFSDDADLVGFENDIMKWLPNGRGSFLDLHRKSQRLIIDWIDRQGYRDDNDDKITKFAFLDNSDVRIWSTYSTLRLFFAGVQNAEDDIFRKKSEYYHKLEIESRTRAVLNLDLDKDGKEDISTKGPDIQSGRLFFR